MTRRMMFGLALAGMLTTGCGQPASKNVSPMDAVSPGGTAPATPGTKAAATEGVVAAAPPLSADQEAAIATIRTAGGAIEMDGGLPRLIDLASDRVFADEATVRAVLQFPQLKSLRLAVSSVLPETLAELKTLTALTEFMLQDAPIADDELAELLQAMPALERLTLRRLNQVSDTGVLAIADCQHLTVLGLIEMNQVSGASLDELVGVKNLRSLDLRNCGGLTTEDFRRLSGFENLAEIKLAGPAINDEVLATVTQMPKLAALTIEDAEITPEGLQTIADHAALAGRLRSLTLARCFNVTDDTLAILPRLGSLETLTLRDMMLSGSFLTDLANAGPVALPLKTLVVNDAFFSDEVIAELPRVAPAIQRLDLQRNPGVTDAALQAIRELPRLKIVCLEGSGVSPEAAAQLQAELLDGLDAVP